MLRTQAELEQARAERALAEAGPRAEDLAAAKGRVSAAEARVGVAEAELAKTRLTAPSDGRILRVYREPGELAGPANSQPILVFADLSQLRVRAFIEEIDALRVELGQRAIVTADSLADQEIIGHVTSILPRIGQRTPRTDAPEEYKDLYFREVLIDLDGNDRLLPNLRVHTRIEVQ